MKNNIFLLVSFILYITIIVLLIYKATDIFDNPYKYNEIKGWKKYRKSYWYEPLELYYKSLYSKNYLAPIVAGIPLMFGLLIAYFFIGYIIQKYILMPEGVMFLFGEGLWLGALGALFFNINLEAWIVFHSTSPLMIAFSINLFSSKSRCDDWKKLVCGMLVASVLCIPVMVLGYNTYAYASDEGIAINDFFEIHEKHISYQDIEYAETTYRSNDNQTEFYFSYYITAKDCEEPIDVLDYCSSWQMLTIHNYIMDEDVSIRKGTISNESYEKMLPVIEEGEAELVKEVFEISGRSE